MRYLGGKSKLAKEIAGLVAPRGYWWEPFCGGLSVSRALAAYGPGLVSDGNGALVGLYQAVRSGWVPPTDVSEADYQAARTAPESPLRTFTGFGCSFGAKWFGGYARGVGRNFADESSRAVVRDVAALGGCELMHLDFLAVEPRASDLEAIYADPPYAGTTGYDAVGAFDHAAFWSRCRGWARLGVRVFVSEYACPVPHTVVWERTHRVSVSGGASRATSTERLFLVATPAAGEQD